MPAAWQIVVFVMAVLGVAFACAVLMGFVPAFEASVMPTLQNIHMSQLSFDQFASINIVILWLPIIGLVMVGIGAIIYARNRS